MDQENLSEINEIVSEARDYLYEANSLSDITNTFIEYGELVTPAKVGAITRITHIKIEKALKLLKSIF